jgi:hypothetical protein
MKFIERHPFADPDAAARKLIEIANSVEAVQDGRIYIERVNEPFLAAGGNGDQFRAGIARAIALGWLWRHESGTFVKFTDSGCGAIRLISFVRLNRPQKITPRRDTLNRRSRRAGLLQHLWPQRRCRQEAG